MQFYTFLETSLATLALLPHFVAFFSDGEIAGTPGNLATTFLAFGKVMSLFLADFLLYSLKYPFCINFLFVTVLNLAFALSGLGFLIMHISLVAATTTTIEVLYGACFFC